MSRSCRSGPYECVSRFEYSFLMFSAFASRWGRRALYVGAMPAGKLVGIDLIASIVKTRIFPSKSKTTTGPFYPAFQSTNESISNQTANTVSTISTNLMRGNGLPTDTTELSEVNVTDCRPILPNSQRPT